LKSTATRSKQEPEGEREPADDRADQQALARYGLGVGARVRVHGGGRVGEGPEDAMDARATLAPVTDSRRRAPLPALPAGDGAFHYDRLSAQDATFLDLEGPTAPQHVAATLVLRSGSLRTPAGGIDIERVRAYVASRLHLIPRYRQRLAHVPVEGHPVWVDDDHFQIDFHVRHTAPRSGRLQLKRSPRISQLDQPPLWELCGGGLGGEHFAIVQKAHHAVIDGSPGWTDGEKRGRARRLRQGLVPRPAPSGRELLASSPAPREVNPRARPAELPAPLRWPARAGSGAVADHAGFRPRQHAPNLARPHRLRPADMAGTRCVRPPRGP
jgi:hypothetical protein